MGVYEGNRAGAADHERAPGTRGSRKAKGSVDGDGRGGRHAASASASEAVDELCELIVPLVAEMQEQTRRLNRQAEAEVDALTVPLCFPNAERWVKELFLPVFSWRVDGRRWLWCSQWWRHAEAIWRLELLWRSWETARRYPTGMSSWSTELDSHLELLLGDQGPFRLCQAEGRRVAQHVDPEPVTAEPAPADWWPTS